MERRRLIIIVGIAALAVLLLAFRGSEDSTGGNTLRVVTVSPPDSLDPGISYQAPTWQLESGIYNGLLTYRKVGGATGTELVPDLAAALPKISDGGKTFEFRMRRGIKFGPPANREVLPSDIAYAIKRNALLPSPGAFYYYIIDGFEKFATTKKGDIPGIVVDDQARTITFHITRPDATFLNILALNFSSAVPKGTPAHDMSQKGFVPATGPYMLSSYDPSSRIVAKRNPSFKEWSKEATPNGKVDAIEIKLNVSDENGITLLTQGKADVTNSGIPKSKLPWLLNSDEWKPYIHRHATSSTSYYWMNVTAPPFDNRKVREAVNWVIDRRAVVKIAGGSSMPSSTILPPTMPGYTGYEPFPKQDIEKAKQLVKSSGITPGKITIWCMTTPPGPEIAQYLQSQLEQLGFEPRTRCVDYSAYYDLIGISSTKAQIGFGAWSQDFPEGSNFIDVLLNGQHIVPKQRTSNYSFYYGKDEEIERVNQMIDLKQRAKEWGRLDREIAEDGAWAPLSHGVSRQLLGKRVGDFVEHPVYGMLFQTATVDGSGTNNKDQHEGEYEPPKDDAAAGGDAADDATAEGGGAWIDDAAKVSDSTWDVTGTSMTEYSQ